MSCRDSQPPRKEDAAQTESQTGSSQGDGHLWWALLLSLSYRGLKKGNARKGTAAREPDIRLWGTGAQMRVGARSELPQRSPTGKGLTQWQLVFQDGVQGQWTVWLSSAPPSSLFRHPTG